jgi:putative holliday junction resolvase
MKVLAIDWGEKNIGLAMSDDDRRLAFALTTLTVETCHGASLQKKLKIVEDIKKICTLEKVERVIVGMPIGLSGNNTKKTEEVFEFVKQLEAELDIPVETEDERLTTVAASKFENKNARNIDELSAQILLQGWLDRVNV